MVSAHSAPGVGGRPSSLPPRSPHLRRQPALLREHPGHLLLVLAPLRCQAPSDDLPGFLSGLLSTSRTRVQGPERGTLSKNPEQTLNCLLLMLQRSWFTILL